MVVADCSLSRSQDANFIFNCSQSVHRPDTCFRAHILHRLLGVNVA